MKHLRLILCCLLLPAFHARGEAPDGEAMRSDVTARLTEFYAYYCHSLTKNGSATDDSAKMKTFVSTRFLKEINRLSKVEGGIEADPFVCAQDNDPKWEKNIKVTHVKAASDGKSASADVALVGATKDMTVHLHVSLVNEGGLYKVDKVKNADL